MKVVFIFKSSRSVKIVVLKHEWIGSGAAGAGEHFSLSLASSLASLSSLKSIPSMSSRGWREAEAVSVPVEGQEGCAQGSVSAGSSGGSSAVPVSSLSLYRCGVHHSPWALWSSQSLVLPDQQMRCTVISWPPFQLTHTQGQLLGPHGGIPSTSCPPGTWTCSLWAGCSLQPSAHKL